MKGDLLPITKLVVRGRRLLANRVAFHELPCGHDLAATSVPATRLKAIMMLRPAVVFVARLVECSRGKHKTFLDSLVTGGRVAIVLLIAPCCRRVRCGIDMDKLAGGLLKFRGVQGLPLLNPVVLKRLGRILSVMMVQVVTLLEHLLFFRFAF